MSYKLLYLAIMDFYLKLPGAELQLTIFPQFDSIIVDYLDVRKRPFIGPLMKWVLRSATAGVLVGVYQFNTNDIGMLSC